MEKLLLQSVEEGHYKQQGSQHLKLCRP